MNRSFFGILIGLALVAAIGCAPVKKQRGQSPLLPARMSPDSVVLDIFFVQLDPADAETCDALWREVDEQRLPAECRRRLWENGLRAGVLTGAVPPALAELLELDNKPAPSDQPPEARPIQPAEKPKVARRHLQLRARTRAEILTGPTREEIPVLTRDGAGRLCGRQYNQAQPLLAATVSLEPDGRVLLDLVPELAYGPVQRRLVSDHPGVLRMDTGRKQRVFDDLAVRAVLASGHMVVVSSLPNRPGSLGHHFFTEPAPDGDQSKLMIVRLSQTQHDGQFANGMNGDKTAAPNP
ncbi:MAG: hypothetical protein JW809_03705 [Pirellulales bacterium]|nr:hypothetical protein [Pirellulales bacterium]